MCSVKAQEIGRWLVLGRNKTGNVKLTDRKVVRSASQRPKVEIACKTSEVVNQERRGQVMTMVERKIKNREAGSLVLRNDGQCLKITMRRYMNLLGSLPLWVWRLARWSFRKSVCMACFLILIWLQYEILEHFGLFAWIQLGVLQREHRALDDH